MKDKALPEDDSRLLLWREGMSRDLSLCDKARIGRPQALDDEALQAAIEENSSQTYGELVRQINTSSKTVRLHLHRIDSNNIQGKEKSSCRLRISIERSENKSGDLSLCDKARIGRPQALDDEALQAAIEENSSQTYGELVRQINTSSKTVRLHLHRIGKTYRLSKRVPHTLLEVHKQQREAACLLLLSRHFIASIFNRVLTSDEKSVLYDTPKRSKHWLSPQNTVLHSARPPMHPRKIMLCVWWTCRQVVHYELLPTGQTVTVDLYSQQFERVQQALHQKDPALNNRKGVLLLHDNARSHVVRVARNTIQRLGWVNLCHPLYSPDLAPSGYHLFHSLDNHLRTKSFTNEAYMRQALTVFFESYNPEFYCTGLNNWRHVDRRCWMPMVITSRTNTRQRCLYAMFFWVIKNDKIFFVYLVH
ncbi:histone-lysine N-methyltransferase SETMAR [Trichonephila clavipes]|nr:histone-lysine N-methyltransferase SETMAR [Trichonephila clavipes]